MCLTILNSIPDISGRDVVVARVDLHGSQSNLHRNSIYRQPDISAADLIQLTKYPIFYLKLNIGIYLFII